MSAAKKIEEAVSALRAARNDLYKLRLAAAPQLEQTLYRIEEYVMDAVNLLEGE